LVRHAGGIAVCAVLALILCAPTAAANSFVQLDFNLTMQSRSRHTVFIELFDDRPLTRDNFLQYVENGRYDESLMHRLSRNFVLQGGGYYPEFITEPPPLDLSLDPTARVDLDGNPATPNPTVNNEFGNLPFRSNLRGTLAMAKSPGNPDSATSEFFFNLSNNGGTAPNGLDFQNGGFTVFAQVVGDGMSYIDALNGLNLTNLNPDVDDDGIRDGGPFFSSAQDAVPFIGSNLVIMRDAERIDYLGAGSATNIPEAGLTISERDMFIDTGAAFTGTGPIRISAGRSLGIREGISLDRTLINQGSLSPGSQLGSITVQDYEQAVGATLMMQLRQATPDTEHDRLVVTETARLNGTLDVTLINNFVPLPGQTFTLLTAAEINGKFATVNLPQLAAGLVWDVNMTTTAVSLSVAAADYNHDGTVNAADYTVWRNTRGTTVPAYTGADGNGDTTINTADFAVWKSNFGNKSGGTISTGSSVLGELVPEPSATLVILMGAPALYTWRWRRR
jgi:cyclophilin family peptidyl-prolyl cis-trans isomerase